MRRMHSPFSYALAMLVTACLAQEEPLPTRSITPDDVVQSSIHLVRFSVRWKYTQEGAVGMLAFRRAHAGQKTILRIGQFAERVSISPLDHRPPGWTEEGWLKKRTDKIVGVSEGEAQKRQWGRI
jgi:hypothetical protein